MKKIKDFIREVEFEIGWTSKKSVGVYDPKEDTVIINIYLLVVETVIHEYMHYQYPKLEEDKIEKMAQAKVSSLTVNQIMEIYSLVTGGD